MYRPVWGLRNHSRRGQVPDVAGPRNEGIQEFDRGKGSDDVARSEHGKGTTGRASSS